MDKLKKMLEKDLDITKRAMEKIKLIAPEKSFLKKIGESFLEMAKAYYSDALYFYKKKNYINSFACVNYAHGWLDAGARLGVFDVGCDERLFTLAE
ncbi:MAG: DUF357 domain-containing protein [Candidatus Thermoplasmatota archaeon]